MTIIRHCRSAASVPGGKVTPVAGRDTFDGIRRQVDDFDPNVDANADAAAAPRHSPAARPV